MAGGPGTVRFGVYGDAHHGKPDSQGEDWLSLQNDEKFQEQHFLFDPVQQSRAMGSTLGEKPGDMKAYQKRLYEAPSNHDGFEGGDAHFTQLDERKVFENTINAIKCEYADDMQHNWNSDERTA